MQFPCARCARVYEIADELVVGRAVKVACPACGNLVVHRVPARGGALAAPPAAAPPPPGLGPALADADDDDFESAWSALEAPPGGLEPPAAARAPSPAAPKPAVPRPAEPRPAEPRPAAPKPAEPKPTAPWPAATRPAAPKAEPPAAPPAPARSAPPAAAPPTPAAPKPAAQPVVKLAPKPAAKRPPAPPPSSLDLPDDEVPTVTAELVLIRRSARRSRMTAAVTALVVVGALVGVGAMGLRWKRHGPGAGAAKAGGGSDGGPGGAGGLSAADAARLMGRAEAEAEQQPAERGGARQPRQASDRPKHPRLAISDKELLDLLAKKGDVAVTVQDDDAAALATTRGSLDSTAIEGTLSRNSSSFAACVSRAASSGLTANRVNLELTIRPSGRVQSAAVADKAVAATPLGQCIAKAAKRMVFPGFDGEPIDIVVPLKLKVGF